MNTFYDSINELFELIAYILFTRPVIVSFIVMLQIIAIFMGVKWILYGEIGEQIYGYFNIVVQIIGGWFFYFKFNCED